MARVEWSTLVRMLREHPDYPTIEKGVPAERALVIVFGPADSPSPADDIFEIVDGSELAVSKTRAGRVTSIEIA